MPVNPIQGGFVPTDIALEHQEAFHQDQAAQTNKTQDKPHDTLISNYINTPEAQQPGEPIPIQHSQEAAQTNYTDRESQGRDSDEEEAEVEEIEKKTEKKVQSLQAGLEQVADGITQLKGINQTAEIDNQHLEQRLQSVSSTGQKLIVEIEKTVEHAVDTVISVSEGFFIIAVKELTALRITISEFVSDMEKRQSRIPTPEIKDHSRRAEILRKQKQYLRENITSLCQAVNALLETSEIALSELLKANGQINQGFDQVVHYRAEGFKEIEMGFRLLFSAVTTVTDTIKILRIKLQPTFKNLALFPEQLQTALGSRAALGIPERLAMPLWQSAELVEQCHRSLQRHLSILSAALTKFGNIIEINFEQAARAVVGQGQVAVDRVNTDLGDLKVTVEGILSPAAAQAIAQILAGASEVEVALDNLTEVSEQKHNTIKRGSTAKLPSHFNVKL